ncbi:MAG: anaerobic ribonucleoside triphosphate reductase [Crenarchaeota archaeon]|nr:anaerobic ribonucleoside triphosphate reductase [Thermoproteota archaeon]MCR8455398.1 anaerobic ribonucleoside triphosphate reductase [Thermoproteota archaeon]MCR8501061.1 anaerobic ribonucleoside triphosphate reductase [Thermoproteota archaeon]
MTKDTISKQRVIEAAGYIATQIDLLEKQYLEEKSDWESRENANVNRSFGAFVNYVLSKALKHPSVLEKYFPKEAVEDHVNSEIHIHKLPLSLFIPYCAGWSLQKLLKVGLKTPTIISNPAKHFDTAISHLVNFFFLAANEWSGAQATSGFDLFLAPFVKHDNIGRKEIRQALQRLVYEINYPSRIGFQSPFTNITIVMDLSEAYLNSDAIVGGKVIGRAGDYINEAIIVDEELLKLYLEGDALGRPFTFPIITLMLTPKFDWNGSRWGELTDLIFQVLAKRGSLYILNGYASDIEGLYAMCCRLTIDTRKLNHLSFKFKPDKSEFDDMYSELKKSKGPRGVWATPDATGSIGVVTINLPRLAIMSNGDEDKFFDMLLDKMIIAREVLARLRVRYQKSLELGLMPLTKIYMQSFASHFSTIGVVGLPEAAVNLIGNFDIWDSPQVSEAIELMRRVVRFIRKKTEEWEELDNVLYNVEEIPGESAAYRLAMDDYRRFKDLVDKGEVFIPILNGEPMYSSSIVPYYAPVPITKRVELEGLVQQEFTGGVMAHLFVGQSIDPKALKKFIYSIVTNTKIVYFSITPAISICTKCSWQGIGIYWNCPVCGSATEVWSRIVGYYRPVQSWNLGRQKEFKHRVHYVL